MNDPASRIEARAPPRWDPTETEMQHDRRLGLLLINLGTPTAPETGPVRAYLREFLNDPRVLDIPPLGRWALLNLFILPFRPAKSAHAYRQIWTDQGSPLLVFHQALATAVQAELGDTITVAAAMRYGEPSIRAGLETLKQADVDEILVLPLYPQYSSSATGSSLEEVFRIAGQLWNVPAIQVMPPFYDDPGFIGAFAAQARPVLDSLRPERVLYSFHGLPERQVRKSDTTDSHCLQTADCCATIGPANRYCYRAQCMHTARALTTTLGLSEAETVVCFQSRLGRTPWISPYTDHVLTDLARQGVKRVAVLCPAFTADCLETLEEIGIRAERDFKAAGGEALTLVPSLNATPEWVSAVVTMVRRQAGVVTTTSP